MTGASIGIWSSGQDLTSMDTGDAQHNLSSTQIEIPENANDNEPLIQRKPVLPPRSSRQSLDDRSYSVIEMQPLSDLETPLVPHLRLSKKSVDKGSNSVTEMQSLFKMGPSTADGKAIASDFPPPKAFKKTHLFFGVNLGYWRMPVRHFSIFSVLFLFTMIPIYLISTHYAITDDGVTPFQYDCYGTSSGWSFVGINLRFGKFSFGGAKAVDLAWNWVVGRGLQAILTWVAYRVFNDALLRVTELTPLSYELYASLSLYSTKPDILWQLLKALTKRRNWRATIIFIWLLISTIYLVFFPSLLDACSGYEVAYTPLFRWPNGTLENLETLYNNSQWDENLSILTKVEICGTWYEDPSGTYSNYTYRIVKPISERPENLTYCSYACCASNRRYSNGTAIHTSGGNILIWNDTLVNKSWADNFQIDPWNTLYPSQGKLQWKDWKFYPTLVSSYRCSTEGHEYQWGFSYEWLFVVVIVNSCWLFGLWVLWVDCDTNSELCKKGRRLGLWRAVADISEAMREELGPNICAYSEQELADALKKRPPLKYYAEKGTAHKPGHIGLSSRASGKFTLKWDRQYGQEHHTFNSKKVD